MCFVHCLPRGRIPSIITANAKELEPKLHRVPCRHDVRKHSPLPSDGARARFMNVTMTTDIVAYETHETRALHCAALQHREHGAVHDEDHVCRDVERGLQKIPNQGQTA